MENSAEKVDRKKELEDKTTNVVDVTKVANKRVPRAYRITLKNIPRTKNDEQKTTDEKDTIENSSEMSAENVPENPDDSPSKRKSRFIKFQTVSEVEAGNDVKEVDPKKKKSALRRKNKNIKKKAENKEILDNILACIVLMEEKLAKHDTQESSDANKGNVDSSAVSESVGVEKTETGSSESAFSSLRETEIMKNENNVKTSEPAKAMDTSPENNGDKTDNVSPEIGEVKDENQGSRKSRKGRSRKTKRKKGNKPSLPEEHKSNTVEDSNVRITTEDKVLNTEKEEVVDKNSLSQEIKLGTPLTSPHNRFRPTHFLACRVYSSDIKRKVDAIQANILNINKDYKPSFVETRYLYSTLAVLSLKDEEEKEKAIKAIELSLQKVGDAYKKSSCKFVEFESLGTFKDQFLFMKMKETEGLELLQCIISNLRENMIEHDVLVRQESFSPHATIAKLRNRYSLKKKGIKKIPGSMYADQKNDYFGKEEITEILLCSLADKKEGEFHNVIASIDLRNNKLILPEKVISNPSDS